MKPIVSRPSADPLDDIDRVNSVDNAMARQDRADLPGNRSDQPGNQEIPLDGRLDSPDVLDTSGRGADAALDPDEVSLDASTDPDSTEIDPDVDMVLQGNAGQPPGRGPDDDEPIEETERMGDDSLTGPD
jgi:hypothetical protein